MARPGPGWAGPRPPRAQGLAQGPEAGLASHGGRRAFVPGRLRWSRVRLHAAGRRRSGVGSGRGHGQGRLGAAVPGALHDEPRGREPRQGAEVDTPRDRGPGLHPRHLGHAVRPRRRDRRHGLAKDLRRPVQDDLAPVRRRHLAPRGSGPRDRVRRRSRRRRPHRLRPRHRRGALGLEGRGTRLRVSGRGRDRRSASADHAEPDPAPGRRSGERHVAVGDPVHHRLRPERGHASGRGRSRPLLRRGQASPRGAGGAQGFSLATRRTRPPGKRPTWLST